MASIMKIDAYTSNRNSCINSKRIYINDLLYWDCPNCNEQVNSNFDQIPFISYGSYCHVFHCDNCDFESKDKMYTLNNIGEDFVDITLSNENNLHLYDKDLQIQDAIKNRKNDLKKHIGKFAYLQCDEPKCLVEVQSVNVNDNGIPMMSVKPAYFKETTFWAKFINYLECSGMVYEKQLDFVNYEIELKIVNYKQNNKK